MIKTSSNTQRAKNVIIIFYVLFAFECLSIISTYLQYDLLANVGDGIDPHTAEMNDTRQRLVSFFFFIVYIIGIVCFIMWFRRAYNNLHLAGVKGLKFGENWAVWSWFVPFINLARPYNIMAEIWDETQRITTVSHKIKEDSLVGIWWASWIVSGIISQLANRLMLSAKNVNDLINASITDIISSFISLISIIIVINLIKQLSQFEQAMFVSIKENK